MQSEAGIHSLPPSERAAFSKYLKKMSEDIKTGRLDLMYYKVTPTELGGNLSLKIEMLVPGGKTP